MKDINDTGPQSFHELETLTQRMSPGFVQGILQISINLWFKNLSSQNFKVLIFLCVPHIRKLRSI